MFISKKRLRAINRKIADLEVQVQSQQKQINLLAQKDRPELHLSQVVQNVLRDSRPSTYRLTVNTKTLSGLINEQMF